MNHYRRSLALALALAIFTITLLCANVSADPIKDPITTTDQLKECYRKIFTGNDVDALLSLQCFDGAEEGTEEAVKDYLRHTLKKDATVEDVAWLPPKGNEETPRTMGGKTYKYNLPVVGRIVVKVSTGGSDSEEVSYVIGKKDERYLMPMRIPAH